MVLISHFKESIIEEDLDRMREYSEIFTQEINYDKLLTKGGKLEISARDMQELREVYEKDFQKLWISKNQETIVTIASLAKFEKEEIDEIQGNFLNLLKNRKDGLTISKEEFSKLLLHMKKNKDPDSFPNLNDTFTIFDLFDINHDNQLNVE